MIDFEFKQHAIYLADLSPRFGTEPGKKRPVVIIQTDLLNSVHPSTVVCPISSQVIKGVSILRIHLNDPLNGLEKPSDILVDQIRAIDNQRFISLLGQLSPVQIKKLNRALEVLLF